MRHTSCSLVWRRIASATLLAVLSLAPSLLRAAQNPIDPYTDDCWWQNLTDAQTVGPFDFQAYVNTETGRPCFDIRRGGRDGEVVFRWTINRFGEFRLGQPANLLHKVPAIPNGTDITGRGHPDMIVTQWSGGEHCCFKHYIFELEPELKIVAQIDDGDGDFAHFADLDGSRHFYYVGKDWTFAFWDASFEDSPAPTVILRFIDGPHGGAYHLAMDKMERPQPTPAEWSKAVAAARDAITQNSGFGDGIGSELWSNMLDLIYTGHSALAWKLFDQAWPAPKPDQKPDQKPDKAHFLAGFCSQLKSSPYWPDLKTTVEDLPPACDHAKPQPSGQ